MRPCCLGGELENLQRRALELRSEIAKLKAKGSFWDAQEAELRAVTDRILILRQYDAPGVPATQQPAFYWMIGLVGAGLAWLALRKGAR